MFRRFCYKMNPCFEHISSNHRKCAICRAGQTCYEHEEQRNDEQVRSGKNTFHFKISPFKIFRLCPVIPDFCPPRLPPRALAHPCRVLAVGFHLLLWSSMVTENIMFPSGLPPFPIFGIFAKSASVLHVHWHHSSFQGLGVTLSTSQCHPLSFWSSGEYTYTFVLANLPCAVEPTVTDDQSVPK